MYIGAKTTVLPGVVIGEGSIIGANSLVNRDIPPFTVAAGNPIRIISTVQEYKEKKNKQLEILPQFSRSYTLWGKDESRKKEMVEQIDRFGFVNTEE